MKLNRDLEVESRATTKDFDLYIDGQLDDEDDFISVHRPSQNSALTDASATTGKETSSNLIFAESTFGMGVQNPITPTTQDLDDAVTPNGHEHRISVL